MFISMFKLYKIMGFVLTVHTFVHTVFLSGLHHYPLLYLPTPARLLILLPCGVCVSVCVCVHVCVKTNEHKLGYLEEQGEVICRSSGQTTKETVSPSLANIYCL